MIQNYGLRCDGDDDRGDDEHGVHVYDDLLPWHDDDGDGVLGGGGDHDDVLVHPRVELRPICDPLHHCVDDGDDVLDDARDDDDDDLYDYYDDYDHDHLSEDHLSVDRVYYRGVRVFHQY